MGFLEVACFSPKSALTAQEAGADRIELCEDMVVGGVTPSLDSFLVVKEKISIPIFVMIRPRGGNFVYSPPEFEQMKRDLQLFRNAGANGFVFGILDSEKSIDVSRSAELVRLAQPLPCTFHRAFDETVDLKSAVADAIACGFRTILTSGGAIDAGSAVKTLESLVGIAREYITIMPGGGVRSSNIQMLVDGTKADWYHSSAITDRATADCDASEIRKLAGLLR